MNVYANENVYTHIGIYTYIYNMLSSNKPDLQLENASGQALLFIHAGGSVYSLSYGGCPSALGIYRRDLSKG